MLTKNVGKSHFIYELTEMEREVDSLYEMAESLIATEFCQSDWNSQLIPDSWAILISAATFLCRKLRIAYDIFSIPSDARLILENPFNSNEVCYVCDSPTQHVERMGKA